MGLGLTMCRICAPGSDGLKGANTPYGRGIWMSGGMYELGLGSAELLTLLSGNCCSSNLRYCLSSASMCLR